MSDPQSSEPTLGKIPSRALANGKDAPPASPLAGAASGGVDALRDMAAVSYQSFEERKGAGCIAGLAEALSFARLAAVNGDAWDIRVVVYLYGRIAEECRNAGDAEAGDAYEAQGYLLAEMMAEDGDEEMADMVVSTARSVPPAAHIEARRLREALTC